MLFIRSNLNNNTQGTRGHMIVRINTSINDIDEVMLAFIQRYLYLLLFLARFMNEAYEQQNCTLHNDCAADEYCCIISLDPLIKACDKDCVQKLCRSKKDCGTDDECCTYSNKCSLWKPDCDCRLSKICEKMNLHCCKQRFEHEKGICKAECVDVSCHEDEDCAPGECCGRTYRCTKDKYTCLDVCNTNTNCFNSIRPYCCGQRFQTRYCSNTCKGWDCMSDNDCGEPKQCCVDNYCTNDKCDHTLTSLKIVIISASVAIFVLICVVIFVACYRKKIVRCVLLQPRVERVELREQSQLPLQSTQNIPPPPYFMIDEPFSTSHNHDFPPIYKLLD